MKTISWLTLRLLAAAIPGDASTTLAVADPAPKHRTSITPGSQRRGCAPGDSPTTYFNRRGPAVASTSCTSRPQQRGRRPGRSPRVTNRDLRPTQNLLCQVPRRRATTDDINPRASRAGTRPDDFQPQDQSGGYQWVPSTSCVDNPVYKVGGGG